MRQGVVIAGLITGAALLAMADSASAQAASTRNRAPALSLNEAQAAASAAPSSRLRFTERGRWGLDLNLTQPNNREAAVGDVEAGAYYRVNPRLRVGAAAGLTEGQADDPARNPQEERRAARFRLQSIFRF